MCIIVYIHTYTHIHRGDLEVNIPRDADIRTAVTIQAGFQGRRPFLTQQIRQHSAS